MKITNNKCPFFHLDINDTYTQLSFIIKVFPHKFFIRVDNPLEMVKILSYIDNNNVLKDIYKNILKMMPNINHDEIFLMFGFLSYFIGKKIPARYFKQVFDSVSNEDKKYVRMLYTEIRKG